MHIRAQDLGWVELWPPGRCVHSGVDAGQSIWETRSFAGVARPDQVLRDQGGSQSQWLESFMRTGSRHTGDTSKWIQMWSLERCVCRKQVALLRPSPTQSLPKGANYAAILVSDSGPQNSERITLHCFKPNGWGILSRQPRKPATSS